MPKSLPMKSQVVRVRLTPVQLRESKRRARAAGMNLSEWVRRLLPTATRRNGTAAR